MALQYSKHNILIAPSNDGPGLIANALYGTADFLTMDEYDAYQQGAIDAPVAFEERGYLVDPDEEARCFKEQYLQFLDQRDKDEIQLFYVADYGCNFACNYCYQSEYAPAPAQDQNEVLQAFFKYVDKTFAGRKVYLTLFGGEPLLPGRQSKENVRRFLQMAKERKLDTAIVTNGYLVSDYMDVLKDAQLREVQMTLDGTRDLHDKRRPLVGGGGTFDHVVAGVDALLAANIPVNLRMVVDDENVQELPKLANFAIEKGWTDHRLFKTQLGRNYELHTCQKNNQALYSRLEMYQAVAKEIAAHPEITRFHKPSFHFVKSLAETHEMPDAIFDACPGCKTEWAFDSTGKIYSCTATVGKNDEALGTFYPRVYLNDDAVEQWQDRDIVEIEKCNNCDVALLCGGGCGSVAKNKNGTVCSPDCRPVIDVAKEGIKLYLQREQ